ncbi:hypothetical protein Back2_29120 [Nocardioides baekrokdamisoli]|uniref:Thioesterase domain-containing protein n=1 Tax=Nocardioides baekrokdamisoli TaxID=1804624 RepID=A0A3G9IRN3_9ACTN|nr:PaaI family thioesterase [Nocardioides baekrokdamisoli]BBH18625.1 hypothetical protein Back2_29120 [Nocardioides baekrokdamisoli]
MVDQLRPNPAYIEAVLADAALSPYRTWMGLGITELECDRALVVLDIEDHHLQLRGTVAGGVMASLIDTATFWSAFVRAPADAGVANVDLRVNYLEAVPKGARRLIAEGRCLRPGRRLSYAEAYVRDERGHVVAHGMSSVLTLAGKGLAIDLPKYLEENE